MATTSRFIKPLNYPPPTLKEMQHSASRLIANRIRGSRTGAEARQIARESHEPALREAARILDERDANAPMGVQQAQRSRQADGTLTGAPSVVPARTTPVSPANPRPLSMASRFLANRRRHGCDGKFISRQFQAEIESVAKRVRTALDDGGAE